MKALNLTILSLVLFSIVSCKKDPSIYSLWTNRIDELRTHNQSKVTINTGIHGTLTLNEGDCMPRLDGNSCKTYPVRRKIRVYEYTLPKDVEGWAPNFKKVNTKLIATTFTDDEGFFQLQLPPAQYSIFIEEKGKLYASDSDNAGGISPVTVNTGIVEVFPKLNYAVH